MAFIIGSGSPQFKENIKAIKEVLSGFGLDGYFALLSEEQKGLDAFCDKICSKIQESRFCVVMLNDPVVELVDKSTKAKIGSFKAPSANVYYEFGMAVALKKPVIPVIRSGSKLPFDVQHLDAIVYNDALDLKEKLKKPILSSLTKREKLAGVSDSILIHIIYGPLYTEIDRFLSKKDKFAVYNPSRYQRILVESKHWFDTIEPNLHEEIEKFYKKLQEFNSLVQAAERIISEIVTRQLLDFSEDRPQDIHVELETDIGKITPTLSQILIRKTTPERYFQAQGIPRSVKGIKYTLEILNRRVEIGKGSFTRLFKKCEKEVENHSKVARMRKLRANLDNQGKELKGKLFKLIQ